MCGGERGFAWIKVEVWGAWAYVRLYVGMKVFAVVGKHTFMNNNKSKYKNGIRNKTNTNIKVRHKTYKQSMKAWREMQEV